jgi:hypothetical protein
LRALRKSGKKNFTFGDLGRFQPLFFFRTYIFFFSLTPPPFFIRIDDHTVQIITDKFAVRLERLPERAVEVQQAPEAWAE